MDTDNSGNQHSQTNPQSTSGVAAVPVFASEEEKTEYWDKVRAGGGAPIFVNGLIEFHKGPLKALNGGMVSRIKYRKWLWCCGLASLYALFFVIAEKSFPQIYQAWLDFCLPLTEYIGGLTPRAERVAGQLVAGGYPELVDDVLHGSAMAQILTIPATIYIMAGTWAAAHPASVVIYCTLWTYTKICIRTVFGLVYGSVFPTLFIWAWAIKWGETIGEEQGFIYTHGQYHLVGNSAMFAELFMLFVVSMLLCFPIVMIVSIRPFRFTIVKQPPENKV